MTDLFRGFTNGIMPAGMSALINDIVVTMLLDFRRIGGRPDGVGYMYEYSGLVVSRAGDIVLFTSVRRDHSRIFTV